MTISTPGEPDRVRTVENDIGEAEVKPQMAEKSVDQLKQAKGVSLKEDGVGKGKGIETPTVNQRESMMEKFSIVDQTTNSSGESSKFYSTFTSCDKSVKAFPEAYYVSVA